jgi:hypothetical protein
MNASVGKPGGRICLQATFNVRIAPAQRGARKLSIAGWHFCSHNRPDAKNAFLITNQASVLKIP